jgi:hypothetical protein
MGTMNAPGETPGALLGFVGRSERPQNSPIERLRPPERLANEKMHEHSSTRAPNHLYSHLPSTYSPSIDRVQLVGSA